jgi:hypothetical protein
MKSRKVHKTITFCRYLILYSEAGIDGLGAVIGFLFVVVDDIEIGTYSHHSALYSQAIVM